MKHIKTIRFGILSMLGVLMLALSGTGAANAQYYPPPGYYGGPPPGYYRHDGPPPGHYRRPPPRRYYDDGYSPYPRRIRIGTTCVTSRGNCSANGIPVGQGCKCYIPGFGTKRGEVPF